MKKITIAAVVGLAVFGAIFAAASLLDTNPAFVQAGSSGDLTCQDEPVTFANFNVELDTFDLDSFRIWSNDGADAPNGDFSDCGDGKLTVRLYDDLDNDLGGGPGRTVDPVSGGTGYPQSILIDLTGVDSRDVDDIRLVFQSANP